MADSRKVYPQDLRNVWADAHAKHCAAVWRVVDARKALADAVLAPAAVREPLEAELARRVKVKDDATAACNAAHLALDAAEKEYFGEA